jgi:hypothetical protein
VPRTSHYSETDIGRGDSESRWPRRPTPALSASDSSAADSESQEHPLIRRNGDLEPLQLQVEYDHHDRRFKSSESHQVFPAGRRAAAWLQHSTGRPLQEAGRPAGSLTWVPLTTRPCERPKL